MKNINKITSEKSEVKGFKKFKNWASENLELLKNEGKKIVVGFTVATMLVTSNCGGKSEIEWTGDKDKTHDEEQVELDEEHDELIDEEQDELIDEEQDEEVHDEDYVDEDLIDEEIHDEIEDEEQDEDIIEPEPEPVPETIVTLELNVDENVVRAVAGETIDINGMEFEVKYDNNDGSIYLMHADEIVRIEWEQFNNANGSDVSVKDIWVNKTAFDTRILYSVTDVNNDKVWNFIANENDMGVGIEYDGTKAHYVTIQNKHNEDWDSGSRTITDFEANVNGVEIKGNDLLIMENEGIQIANYFIEATYSPNLYNGENAIIAIKINCEDETIIYAMEEKVNKNIDVCGNMITISVENTFFDERNMKWWANIFTSTDLVKTGEQDVPLDYKDYTITVRAGEFINE
jgi:hypothetical protein